MADVPSCVWTGKSGTKYTFWIYSLPASFDPNQPGNYIYTKMDSQGYWQPIYIGQGDLNDRANNHHQAMRLRQKGATHFHCHKNVSEQSRLAEESDLLAMYTQAYAPIGCNDRTGG
jgi:hypothetical protein